CTLLSLCGGRPVWRIEHPHSTAKTLADVEKTRYNCGNSEHMCPIKITLMIGVPMCGRYTMSTNVAALEERFRAQLSADVAPTYNAAPSQGQLTILNAAPHVMTVSTWGFVPEWANGRHDVQPLINARAETVVTKPFFRDAFKRKRCLVLADGFYEWRRIGTRK